MHPDPVGPLAQAAARRHELTRSKAIQALRELDRSGQPVTFAAVAQAAGISRSWLYAQADISDQIRRLRESTDSVGSAIPAAQRATGASLRARLTAALDRNKQLADENARLRRQLAHALGATRRERERHRIASREQPAADADDILPARITLIPGHADVPGGDGRGEGQQPQET